MKKETTDTFLASALPAAPAVPSPPSFPRLREHLQAGGQPGTATASPPCCRAVPESKLLRGKGGSEPLFGSYLVLPGVFALMFWLQSPSPYELARVVWLSELRTGVLESKGPRQVTRVY